jgi:hypothetical protein
MHATGRSRGLDVTSGGTGVVSHAGLALVRQLSDRTGLTSGPRPGNGIASATREPAAIGRRNDPPAETSSSGDGSLTDVAEATSDRGADCRRSEFDDG